MTPTIDYGIDLGTTNSSIAVCRRGEIRIFHTSDLMNVTPSVVCVSKAKRMLVGKRAYDIWIQDPQNTQAEFKRWMGYSDKLKFPASELNLAAEELSAEILKSLRSDAERQTGESIQSAVITVPAAFGSVQCEATMRAANLAGITTSPLLQEPVAAAIAYGATPSSGNQRWLVFDLGGGTLDIAIVSTRNNRLAVLEHQGNNRLGGKDLDRILMETFLLPALTDTYHLPDAKEDPQRFQPIARRLLRHAEQAKIQLSAAEETIVDLLDIGQDLDGTPMELSLPLKRSAVEACYMPFAEQCLHLATRALEGARLSGSDLDRILLVGGPTQMPMIRTLLQQRLGARLDYSLDPMTVVAQGAAIYAATQEKPLSSGAVPSAPDSTSETEVAVPNESAANHIVIQLAYERASGSLNSPVVGIIANPAALHEVRIDSASGHWTSGWLPVVDGCFQTEVMLQDGKPATVFHLAGRDKQGTTLSVEPNEFVIAHMMAVSTALLPHSIAIELSVVNGLSTFDPVFKRNSPLPAEVRKTYKANRSLRPSDFEAVLPIKFWEIDVSEDPEEKWWAGSIKLSAQAIKRPIHEGADIELTIKIDASRKMTVEMFIPILNQSFQNNVYVPDPPTARSQIQQQIDLCFERLFHIREEIYAGDHDAVIPHYEALQEKLENFAEEFAKVIESLEIDPDASLRLSANLRNLRVNLSQLEERLNIQSAKPTLGRKMRYLFPFFDRNANSFGTPLEIEEFNRLQKQYERYVDLGDIRGQKWVHDQLWYLHRQIVDDQFDYWAGQYQCLQSPLQCFVNKDEAQKALTEAAAAYDSHNLTQLKEACRKLFALQPEDELERGQDREAMPGLSGRE